MRVQCKLCAPATKTLSSARNTTSNLRKHLTTVHKSTQLVPTDEDKTKKRKSLEGDDESERQSRKKQCTLSSGSLSQPRLRRLVAEYIIEDMLPISTVESPAFSKLVYGVSSSNLQLPSRRSMTVFLDKAYDLMIATVKGTLETVESVCTTADVWTANRRSYMGMTVHWIDSSTLKRHRAALAHWSTHL